MARIEERLRIESDGTVTALSGKMEYGQGLSAAYPRIVAEELSISPSRVRVILGDTDYTPWDMGTFGSMSVEMDGHELRQAAAFARSVLLARAGERFASPTAQLEIRDGCVRRTGDARTISFGELVADAPIQGPIPDDVALASPPPTCPDGPPDGHQIVTGQLEFAGDVRLPGMLHGAVLHPAVHGATLRRIDREKALATPGIVAVVHEAHWAGVVAHQQDQAFAAVAALNPEWDVPGVPTAPPTDVRLREDAGTEAALFAASSRLSRRYFTPHVAGQPLGPSVGLVDVTADGATIYATTQVPFRLREQVARIAGLPVERVHFKPKAMSGGFGRHGASDAAIEAARLSKAVGRPVQVQWRRVDELRAGPNRPEMTAELEAALDPSGAITAWLAHIWTNPYAYDGAGPPPRAQPSGIGHGPASGQPGGSWSNPAQMVAMMAGRNAIPPYQIPCATIVLHVAPAKVRTGALRSLGASPNTFATESFMDELAHIAGRDPIEFRLSHITDPRLRRVLMTVRDRSDWGHRPDSRCGLGVACVVYRNTYVAAVVEVAVGVDGKATLDRVWCALDPGHVVHPNGARNQVEGAVQMAASWTLLEELPHRDAEVTGSTWKDYPIATCIDSPRAIDVSFVGDNTTAAAGLGEPPAVPIAPAIANAIFSAGGARVRQLPIRPAAVLAAFASR